MGKVTGLGGIFFKCQDPQKIKEWYSHHLGMNTNDYGASFEWRHEHDPDKKGMTLWSPFKQSTTYFEPSQKDYMINFRVNDIEGLVTQMKQDGVTILDEIQDSEYGKFVHILDLEGNKIELWESGDAD